MIERDGRFPGENWPKLSAAQAGWNQQALRASLLQAKEQLSTGVVMLNDGKIAAEQYWQLPELHKYPPQLAAAAGRMSYGCTAEGYPLEDVASVQKSVTATLMAIAADKGIIVFDDPVEKYLGEGWANVTPEQSAAITIRHVMTMTSGLTETLDYDAPPASKWQYNTGAYQNLLRLLVKASGMNENEMTRQWLTERIGMTNTRWVERGWAKQSPPMMGLVTTPRDLARFGLLVMNKGQWNDEQLLPAALVDELTRPSQSLNPSYGMLFWLNASAGYRTPASQTFVEGKRMPAAPDDMVAALGAMNRFVFILPSQKIVIVRTGLVDPANPEQEHFARHWWETLARVFD